MYKEVIEQKGIGDLLKLERDIDEFLSGKQFGVAVNYWDKLLIAVKKRRAILGFQHFIGMFKERLSMP